MLKASYDGQGEHDMNAQFSFEIQTARQARMLEGDNRERLADIARAGHTNSNRFTGIVTLFRRVVQRGKMSQQHSPAVSDIRQPTASGAGQLL